MSAAVSPALAPPLGDLLGARWSFGAAIAGVAWDGVAQAAFALRDGGLVLARAAWAGGPELQERPAGGIAVVPPSVAGPPVSRTPLHPGGCLAIAADPQGGFLTGGADGRLLRVEPDGSHRVMAKLDGHRVGVVAAGAAWRAGAAGREVRLFGARPTVVDAGHRVWALGFDPAGKRLAVAHDGGVLVWTEGAAPESLSTRSPPRALAWHPGGSILVAHLADGSIKAWTLAAGTAVVRRGEECAFQSAVFTSDGVWLVTSGANEALCWRLDDMGPPIRLGHVKDQPVSRIACHPSRPLIAVGYGHGAVLLCQPDTRDAMFVSHGGEAGAVTALAWSATGEHLAFGTRNGEARLVHLPDRLFRAPNSLPAGATP